MNQKPLPSRDSTDPSPVFKSLRSAGPQAPDAQATVVMHPAEKWQTHESRWEMKHRELRIARNTKEAAFTDITQTRLAEYHRSIRIRMEATGSLAAGLAHDYAELLATVLLNLELAHDLIPPKEAFLDRHIDAAVHAATLAQELTRQMATLATHPAATGTVPVDLPLLLDACCHAILDGHPIHCTFQLAEDLWPVAMHAGQLGQSLRQVLLNAREAMPRGGNITLHAENLRLAPNGPYALVPGDYVLLSVTDEGGGIPKATQPRVFDPYFSTKPKNGHFGRGLGLTICEAIIRMSGGAIDFESQEGVGTTFHIHLPASRPRAGPGSPETQAAPRNPAPAPTDHTQDPLRPPRRP